MKSALVISFTNLERDPRILRQIEWLSRRGWKIDALGLGRTPNGVSNFYSAPLKPQIHRYLAYVFSRGRDRFNRLYGDQVPPELLEKLSGYDTIILNELEYSPLLPLAELADLDHAPRLYVDLHENHLSTAASNIFEKVAFERYWKWQLEAFKDLVKRYKGSIVFSSVEDRIAELYTQALGHPVNVIRNAPSWHVAKPKPVNADALRLVHHGMGTRNRGIETTIRALRYRPGATLDLFLVSGTFYKMKIRLLSSVLGVSKRVRVNEPVPTKDIPATISEFDIATVIIPPATENHLHALPNKFFESIQAGLAIVVGPNPSLSSIVQDEGIGIVLLDWSSKSLGRELQRLTGEQVSSFKMKAVQVAERYSCQSDEATFNKILEL